jgi:hypothetical protein
MESIRVPAIVGSVIRTEPHSGKAKAGYVALFVAVRILSAKVNKMPVSFSKDILPLFTKIDIDHMKGIIDLASYDDVKANADVILRRLKGKGGPVMLPPPAKSGDGPWPPERIALFRAWNDGGLNP